MYIKALVNPEYNYSKLLVKNYILFRCLFDVSQMHNEYLVL
jgi:hypothetical protein